MNVERPQGVLDGYAGLWRLMTFAQRCIACALFAGNLAGTFLEIAGLGLLSLLLSALTSDGRALQGGWIGSLQSLTGSQVAIQPGALLVACAATFLAKNVLMAALAWVESTLVFEVQGHLADRALRDTLAMPYERTSRTEPAEQVNAMTSDLHTAMFHFALPSLGLFSEVLLTLGILGFLAWAEPWLTGAVVLCVGAAAAVLMVVSRRAVERLGGRRQRLEDVRMLTLREVFGNLREVYVYRAAGQLATQLQGTMAELGHVYRAYTLLATGPRFVLELALIFVLLGAIAIGLTHGDRHALIVSVGVFAASGFRLLIGANRMIVSTQGIRFAAPALRRVLGSIRHAESALPARASAPPASAHRTLALEKVTYGYPGAGGSILDGVTLALERGVMLGIEGSSGGGKTTLLEILAGLRTAQRGSVLLDGQPVPASAGALFRVVGYVGQSPSILPGTVRRNVSYGADPSTVDDGAVWDALERTRLAGFVRSLPAGLDEVIGGPAMNLSGGQAQRLALARALYAGCHFLLLDEPTSALDPSMEDEVVDALTSLASDMGILLVSHRPKPLAACDTVYELRDGRLHPA